MWRVLALFLISSPAFAQQSPEDLRRIIGVIEAQRNQALTNHALSEAHAVQLTEENSKLRAEIEELKKKVPDAK